MCNPDSTKTIVFAAWPVRPPATDPGRIQRPVRRGLRSAVRLALPAVCGLAMMLGATGCASLGVQPWERDLLAQPAMQFVAAPLDAAADDHTYFSKEAATGGRGFGGGGCGCN